MKEHFETKSIQSHAPYHFYGCVKTVRIANRSSISTEQTRFEHEAMLYLKLSIATKQLLQQLYNNYVGLVCGLNVNIARVLSFQKVYWQLYRLVCCIRCRCSLSLRLSFGVWTLATNVACLCFVARCKCFCRS